jgi:hypothetical protein
MGIAEPPMRETVERARIAAVRVNGRRVEMHRTAPEAQALPAEYIPALLSIHVSAPERPHYHRL